MLFIALSRSSLVRTLPPTTFRSMPLMALSPVPTSPPEADFCLAAAASSRSLADMRISSTSLSRSFSTNWPLDVFEPQLAESTCSTADDFPTSTSESLVWALLVVE